jgi:hypothetical protein
LDRKTQEALDRYIATIAPPPDRSPEEFEALKQQARVTGRLTLAVFGSGGEQLISSSGVFPPPEQLPDRIVLVTFDSAAALQQQNVNIPNRLMLRLDFTEPSAIVTYDPNNQPTPNNSQLEVSGPDDTWVTAVHEWTMGFLRARRRRRSWLHSVVTFNATQWLLGIPAALWLAYRTDTKLATSAPSLHTALRGIADVYLFLVGMLFFRVFVYGFRWIFPLVELEGASSKAARRVIGATLGSLLLALLYDVLKALAQ